MEVEIRVDRVRCIGSGQCVHVAPGVFDQDDDAISVVVNPRGEPEEKIVHAVTACPVQAITLHVDRTPVRADDLQDWARGARCDDPIVSLLERLCDDHHELRIALTATPSGDADRAEQVCELTRAHLRNEERAYSVISALANPRLVDAFGDDHGRIDHALDEIAVHRSDPGKRDSLLRDLARVVDDHIRLEETVLFPLALAALARRQPQQQITTT